MATDCATLQGARFHPLQQSAVLQWLHHMIDSIPVVFMCGFMPDQIIVVLQQVVVTTVACTARGVLFCSGP